MDASGQSQVAKLFECDPESGVPLLQDECTYCKKRGVIRDYEADHVCPRCGGSGYRRTEFGQKVLDLMRSNFVVLMREMIDGEMARR
jgi:predicted RNA-binding Zn-ribbon protein involved in translation (DUF1610 family)